MDELARGQTGDTRHPSPANRDLCPSPAVPVTGRQKLLSAIIAQQDGACGEGVCIPVQASASRDKHPHPGAIICILVQASASQCKHLHPSASIHIPMQASTSQYKHPHPIISIHIPVQASVSQCSYLHPGTSIRIPVQASLLCPRSPASPTTADGQKCNISAQNHPHCTARWLNRA